MSNTTTTLAANATANATAQYSCFRDVRAFQRSGGITALLILLSLLWLSLLFFALWKLLISRPRGKANGIRRFTLSTLVVMAVLMIAYFVVGTEDRTPGLFEDKNGTTFNGTHYVSGKPRAMWVAAIEFRTLSTILIVVLGASVPAMLRSIDPKTGDDPCLASNKKFVGFSAFFVVVGMLLRNLALIGWLVLIALAVLILVALGVVFYRRTLRSADNSDVPGIGTVRCVTLAVITCAALAFLAVILENFVGPKCTEATFDAYFSYAHTVVTFGYLIQLAGAFTFAVGWHKLDAGVDNGSAGAAGGSSNNNKKAPGGAAVADEPA